MPQTIMLAVHCKKSEPVEFKGPIVEYVKGSYGAEVNRGQRRGAGGARSAAAGGGERCRCRSARQEPLARLP